MDGVENWIGSCFYKSNTPDIINLPIGGDYLMERILINELIFLNFLGK